MFTETDRRPPIPAAISGPGVVGIGRRLDPAAVLPIGEGLAKGGVKAFEITLGDPDAQEAISRLADRFPEGSELLLGAGTVLDRGAAEAAIGAGARFLVMPHLDEELVRWAAARGIPTFPGAFTPTEILAAWRAGASAVKLFPSSVVGPAFIREFRGPFPDIPLIPTGGVTLESAPGFIAAGAVAVGLGSWLMAAGDAGTVEVRARSVVEAVARARSESAV